jgi:hypothetical protein
MSSEVLLTSLETSESGGAEPKLLPPLEQSEIYSRLPEPSNEELDAVLSGEKSHDGGDHAEADTQHRIEHLEPFFRMCSWFGLHAAATAPLKPWQKAHGIVIVILMGVCGIRAALAVRQLIEFSSFASLNIFVAVFFLGSIPAFMLKLRIFWSRPQLHRSFSLLLDPVHDALMHSSRIDFSKRARSIWSHKLFYFYLLCQISSSIWACYAYFSYWSALVEITGAVGIYASLILEAIIIPYVAQCIICEVLFVQFVCDSHVCAIRRLEALFVSSRLAQSLEGDLMDFKSDRTLGSFLNSR